MACCRSGRRREGGIRRPLTLHRPSGRFLWQFVSRGRLVDPDRPKPSLGDTQGVRLVPVAAPHWQRAAGLDLPRSTQILLKNVCTVLSASRFNQRSQARRSATISDRRAPYLLVQDSTNLWVRSSNLFGRARRVNDLAVPTLSRRRIRSCLGQTMVRFWTREFVAPW